jgi:thiazole synthase ThiGH ThiG subunit
MLGRDFRLEIGSGTADMYEVVARAPDGIEAAVMMRLPVSTAELAALAARIPDAVIASPASDRVGHLAAATLWLAAMQDVAL